jgi:hypothetical protein
MWVMNGVFKDYLDNFVIFFLDDILIYSNLEEEHEQHLRMVLQILREHKVYTKISKCIFYQRNIHYLGHIILEEVIIVDPKKIHATRGWPTPRNFTEFISFMGISIYYRRFIKVFSKIVSPITSFQNKGVKFEWNSKCKERFQ